ncbi:hypothetical protein D6T91_08860 [Salmonella enterica subsp. houtenae]|nr:hypothetical protein [Salmonella enterica subsp. houtenae]
MQKREYVKLQLKIYVISSHLRADECLKGTFSVVIWCDSTNERWAFFVTCNKKFSACKAKERRS